MEQHTHSLSHNLSLLSPPHHIPHTLKQFHIKPKTRETLVHQPLSSPDTWTTHTQHPSLFGPTWSQTVMVRGAPRSLLYRLVSPTDEVYSPSVCDVSYPIHSFISFSFRDLPTELYTEETTTTFPRTNIDTTDPLTLVTPKVSATHPQSLQHTQGRIIPLFSTHQQDALFFNPHPGPPRRWRSG